MLLHPTFCFTILLLVFRNCENTASSKSEAYELKANPTVQIANGILQGKLEWAGNGKPVNAFLGVPFAQPPLGDLRFQRPLPFDSQFANGTWDATKLPNACPQAGIESYGDFEGEALWNPNTPISEDCLYLNIWVPSEPSSTPRKVFFWIYGGGFFSGTSTLDIYNGAILASETNSIVVSTQYRLGILGFLYLGIPSAPGNQGLLDQQMALKWVRKNIKAFGGNPDEVTIMGESAGAVSTSYHVLSPTSVGLFKRAVLMSGSATADIAYENPTSIKKTSTRNLEVHGCSTTNQNEGVACLKQIDWKVLVEKQAENEFDFVWAPTMDDFFLPEPPHILLNEKSEQEKVDLMIGSTKDEGSYFLIYAFPQMFSPTGDPPKISQSKYEDMLKQYFKELNHLQKEAVIFQYTDWDDDDPSLNRAIWLSDAIGDAHFTCPLKKFVDIWSPDDQSRPKVFYYWFSHKSNNDPWADWMGVKHGYEIHYFLGIPLNAKDPSWTPEERMLSSVILQALNNFAEHGSPSSTWERYTSTNPRFIDLNATKISTVTVPFVFGPRQEQCKFWNEFMLKLN